MTSTGVGNSLPRALVECSLKVLQSSALGQIGQTRLLQGTSLGGFSCDGSTQGIHVPVAKFLSLQRVEWLGLVLFVVSCRVAAVTCSTTTGEARGTVGPIDHQDFRRWITATALGCSLYGASRQIEQAVERFVGLYCRDLGGGRLASHCVSHPSLKSRPTGALAPAGNGEGGQHRSRPVGGRWLPQENAADARAKVRCPADRECVHIERSLLEPSRVIGDESERTETDLAALDQSSARNHDGGNRTNCNFSKKSLRHLPQGGRHLSWF